MALITRYTEADFDKWIQEYESYGFGGGGKIDPVSKIFGIASHERFYIEMEWWASVINSFFPSNWLTAISPISIVREPLLGVVRGVYGNGAKDAYWKGLDAGRGIVSKVEQVVNWAQSQINTAVTDMQTHIQRDIIDPLQAKADGIRKDLNGAKTQIDDAVSKAAQAVQDSDVAKQAAATAQSAVASVQSQVSAFDSKLKGLSNQAGSLDGRIKDASTLLSQHKADIDNLFAKVKALENGKGDQNILTQIEKVVTGK